MLLGPVALEPVGGVAHPFVFEVTMAVEGPYVVPTVAEVLLGIVLIRLPLGTLFPEAVAAIRTIVAIAEACREVVGSTVKHLVAIDLILEGVANLMADGGADGLAGGRIDPKGTDDVVVARTGGEPLGLIEQVDLHLVLVEIGLALTSHHHAETVDIGFVELFCLLQQVVHIHAVRLSQRTAVGVVAEICIPEHEEVFGLLHASERPASRAGVHVHRTEFGGLVVLFDVLDFFYLLDYGGSLRYVDGLFAGTALDHYDGIANRRGGVGRLALIDRHDKLVAHEAECLVATDALLLTKGEPVGAFGNGGCPVGETGEGIGIEGIFGSEGDVAAVFVGCSDGTGKAGEFVLETIVTTCHTCYGKAQKACHSDVIEFHVVYF